jgi:putative hydrolase of the HAD superfamily
MPQSAVYVGDNYELDYLGARGAGLKAVWLDRAGLGRPGEPIERISTLDELPEVLAGL